MEKKRKASAMAVYPRPTPTCTAEDVPLKRAIGLGNRSAPSSPGLEGPARFVDCRSSREWSKGKSKSKDAHGRSHGSLEETISGCPRGSGSGMTRLFLPMKLIGPSHLPGFRSGSFPPLVRMEEEHARIVFSPGGSEIILHSAEFLHRNLVPERQSIDDVPSKA